MFKSVNNKVDFASMEEGVLGFWKQNDIFKKSVENRSADNEYVFYDGPPFATGLPHFGHFIPSTIKDIIPRYQTMKGKKVERTEITKAKRKKKHLKLHLINLIK